MIIGSYAQEKKSQVEGTWKLVSAKWTIRGQAFTFPDQISGEQIKMFTKGHVTFVGQYKLPTDTLFRPKYAWGTYTLNGNKFEENVKFHYAKAAIGKVYYMLTEIRNDSLIQKFFTDKNWKLPENYDTEIYVRLD